MAVIFNDKQRAGMLYELLRPYSYINATSVLILYTGSVSHYLGELAHSLGYRQQAAKHLEEALNMNLRLEHCIALGMTCQSFGRLLDRMSFFDLLFVDECLPHGIKRGFVPSFAHVWIIAKVLTGFFLQ